MTSKPTGNPRDVVLARRSQLTAKRDENRTALVAILKGIPKLAPGAIDRAVDELLAAADSYLTSHPIVDDCERHTMPGVADARRAMTRLQKALAETQVQLSNLPLNAMSELSTAYQAQNYSAELSDEDDGQAPMGRINSEVAKIFKATTAALFTLNELPDKSPDHFRVVLAYQVAVVFPDILKRRPSSTLEKQLKENKARGGAAYDRVLRATFKAAGVDNFDSGPLVTEGLKLLKHRKKSLPKRTKLLPKKH